MPAPPALPAPFDAVPAWLAVSLLGVAAAFWNQTKALLARLAGTLVVTAAVNDELSPCGTILLAYLTQRHPAWRQGDRKYLAESALLKGRDHHEYVLYEYPDGPRVFLVGGVPLWVRVNGGGGTIYLLCRWARGSLDFEALQVAAHADEDRRNRDLAERVEGAWGNTSVKRITGHAGSYGGSADIFSRKDGMETVGDKPAALQHPGAIMACLRHSQRKRVIRLLGGDPADLDADPSANSPLENLALDADAQSAVADVLRWRRSESWYRKRDVPWRYGLLLHGAPGTGKSSLVYALACQLRVTILAFDLASLTNADFIKEWQQAVREYSYFLALFEDFDAVFEGRKNVTGVEGGLTFDAFLNTIGGVEPNKGILTVITTNRPETLDPAIATVGVERASRPGRIDRVVELGPPDEAGRRKIAGRILADAPDLVPALVAAGTGDSGAQFVDRCRLAALRRYCGEPGPVRLPGTGSACAGCGAITRADCDCGSRPSPDAILARALTVAAGNGRH